jgi:hypothetical protein
MLALINSMWPKFWRATIYALLNGDAHQRELVLSELSRHPDEEFLPDMRRILDGESSSDDDRGRALEIIAAIGELGDITWLQTHGRYRSAGSHREAQLHILARHEGLPEAQPFVVDMRQRWLTALSEAPTDYVTLETLLLIADDATEDSAFRIVSRHCYALIASGERSIDRSATDEVPGENLFPLFRESLRARLRQTAYHEVLVKRQRYKALAELDDGRAIRVLCEAIKVCSISNMYTDQERVSFLVQELTQLLSKYPTLGSKEDLEHVLALEGGYRVELIDYRDHDGFEFIVEGSEHTEYVSLSKARDLANRRLQILRGS